MRYCWSIKIGTSLKIERDKVAEYINDLIALSSVS